MKNRIINGAMVIDQRNAGASVTPTDSQYLVDRWNARLSQAGKYTAQQNAGSVTTPAGFVNYLGMTSTSAYSVGSSDYFFVNQIIEGYNIADLAYGTASAKTVTISAYVYSSLTGTFGGVLFNPAASKSYPFTFTISSANTWTQISVTIPGDTSGATNTTNNNGFQLRFGLGVGSSGSAAAGSWQSGNYFSATGAVSVVGTNGATFYITGVQLEVGSSATGFEYRQYGQELALCQRYYYQIGGNGYPLSVGYCRASSRMDTYAFFPVTMRASPTGSVVSGSNYYFVDYSQASTNMNSFTIDSTYPQGARLINTGLSGLTAASGCALWSNNSAAYASFSAEL
jgi:hypothetical protein